MTPQTNVRKTLRGEGCEKEGLQEDLQNVFQCCCGPSGPTAHSRPTGLEEHLQPCFDAAVMDCEPGLPLRAIVEGQPEIAPGQIQLGVSP